MPPTPPPNFMLVSCIIINLLLLIFMLILITLFPSPLAGAVCVITGVQSNHWGWHFDTPPS